MEATKPFIKEREIEKLKQMADPNWASEYDNNPTTHAVIEGLQATAKQGLRIIEAQENRIWTLQHSNDYVHSLNKKLKKENRKLFQKLMLLTSRQPTTKIDNGHRENT